MIPFNSRLPRLDELVEEVAVSVNINGINHAVMMATPDDLDDFAIGFLFGEGIIGGNHDVHDIQSTPSEHGIVLDVTIANRCLAVLGQRKRRLAGASGCGICGEILACREDIGRHNALDKLIGMQLRQPVQAATLVITSRCGSELIHKAVQFGAAHLISLASPSQLAVRLALKYNLTLIHVPRSDAPVCYASPRAQDHVGDSHVQSY